ncbi:hypothetical protein, partial [uncultured Bacteroides sp.]|uniref:hypothetical protein n=1 Tax=uncultured Bacteroides sp. TaxID=162156 RepID=UPI00267754A6
YFISKRLNLQIKTKPSDFDLGLKENIGYFPSIHNIIPYRRNFARKKAGIYVIILQLIQYICQTF